MSEGTKMGELNEEPKIEEEVKIPTTEEEIARMKAEIEELNSSVQESTAMSRYGADNGFDKEATYSYVENKILENESNIRNLEKGIKQEQSQKDIDDLKKEIEELNQTVQESSAMSKFGADHGFDKEATYSYIENRILENEAKIRELEGESKEPAPEEVVEKTETPESIETIEVTDKEASDAVAEAVVADLPPEEAQETKEFIEKNWFQLKREQLAGMSMTDIGRALVSKDALRSMGVGAATGAALRMGMKTAMGLSGGLALGAGAGAISASGRKVLGAELKSFNFRSAESLIDNDGKDVEPKILQRVNEGGFFGQRVFGFNKLSRIDAMQLLEEKRIALEQDPNKDEVTKRSAEKVRQIYQKLAENKEEVEKLSGYDKLQKYIALAESVEVMDEANALRKVELQEAIAISTGREVTTKQVLKAALYGAIGGAVGYGIANYLSGGHEGATEALKTAHEHTTGVTAEHDLGKFYPHNTPLHTEVVPPHEELVRELKVKGTVWGTLKEFYKSKGINLNNDQLNTATRYITEQNRVGIAIDHPGVGTYDVMDIRIPDGTVLHGIDKLGDLHGMPHIGGDQPFEGLPGGDIASAQAENVIPTETIEGLAGGDIASANAKASFWDNLVSENHGSYMSANDPLENVMDTKSESVADLASREAAKPAPKGFLGWLFAGLGLAGYGSYEKVKSMGKVEKLAEKMNNTSPKSGSSTNKNS